MITNGLVIKMSTEEFVEYLKGISSHFWKFTPKFNADMEALRETNIYNYFEVVRRVIENTALIGRYKPEDFMNTPYLFFQSASWLSYDMWYYYLENPWFTFMFDIDKRIVLAQPLWVDFGATISKNYPYLLSKQNDYWFKTPFELLPEQYMIDFQDILFKVDEYIE